MAPLQTAIFLNFFGPQSDEHFFEGLPKLLIIFREIPSLVKNLSYQHCISIYLSDIVALHTGCNRRNVRDFGRVFLRSNYTDITQNTHIQSSMFTEILAIEKCGLL